MTGLFRGLGLGRRSPSGPPPPPAAGLRRRWGLITFAPTPRILLRVKHHMPRLHLLRVQVAREFYDRHVTPRTDWVRWAESHVVEAMAHDYDVVVGLTDGPSDIGPELADRAIRLLTRLHETPYRRRLAGVVLDLEWENERYVHGGAMGYVRGVAPAIRRIRAAFPALPILGPGGTHSDDRSLPRVLDELDRLDAPFDAVTFHAYSDHGWDEYDRRLERLRRVFASHGYDRAHATEVGVTGQVRWGDDLADGDALERHRIRFGQLKHRIDTSPWIEWAFIYQVTEPPAPAGEDHGWGFGMFDHDWRPKPATELFQ